ncbi:hypothetical protein QJS04_geneDACA009524 [Acorus gramineus]|uniref:rRNA adenine N(6)-methyltransferase n=1 Tax=Acorus gramineus TaxID=55184 RepID=A0AAV9AG40_ACOGR|nr:hypothetical protein QJS04_geneDACA009524 [Acorus gramineus]
MALLLIKSRPSNLTNPAVRALRFASSDGRIQLHKSKGQHILTNPRVLDAIVRRSGVGPSDTVLEIGPGTGNLTLRLLEASRRVVAVEVDRRMVDALSRRAEERGFRDRLEVIHDDFLKTKMPSFDLCISNIPYMISSPLIMKLLFESVRPFKRATLLLQKEFAHRLLAKPGNPGFNRLAVNVKLVAGVEFVMNVSKRDFVPCPKVDSTVVTITPKLETPNVDLEEWRAFTRTCFNTKNKTVGAIFKQKRLLELLRRSEDRDGGGYVESEDGVEMGLFKDRIIGVLKQEGFEERRPSKMGIEELLHLLELFNQVGIFFNERRKI